MKVSPAEYRIGITIIAMAALGLICLAIAEILRPDPPQARYGQPGAVQGPPEPGSADVAALIEEARRITQEAADDDPSAR